MKNRRMAETAARRSIGFVRWIAPALTGHGLVLAAPLILERHL